MSALDPEIGREQARLAISTSVGPEQFVQRLGWHGFLWIIRERLDTIYPAPNFRSPVHLTWESELDNGTPADPGVKWATLLDMALAELGPKDG